jgi:hypothetical protein
MVGGHLAAISTAMVWSRSWPSEAAAMDHSRRYDAGRCAGYARECLSCSPDHHHHPQSSVTTSPQISTFARSVDFGALSRVERGARRGCERLNTSPCPVAASMCTLAAGRGVQQPRAELVRTAPTPMGALFVMIFCGGRGRMIVPTRSTPLPKAANELPLPLPQASTRDDGTHKPDAWTTRPSR